MSPYSSEEFARGVVRTVQIIVFALAVGPVVFAGIALIQRMNQPPQQDAMIAYLAVGFAVTALGVRSLIGAAMATKQRKQIAAGSWSLGPNAARGGLPTSVTDGDRLLFAFQQKTITESALVEGAMFFVLISFMIVGQWWSLAVAGVLLVVNVVPFPTYDRIENWVRYQLELMESEKR
jgi:hypothetical protein